MENITLIPFNPFPNKPWFLRVYSKSLLKTLWEKEKLLLTSNFSFSHSVFYLFRELLAIFIKLGIVVCELFQFGSVWNSSFGKGLNEQNTHILNKSLKKKSTLFTLIKALLYTTVNEKSFRNLNLIYFYTPIKPCIAYLWPHHVYTRQDPLPSTIIFGPGPNLMSKSYDVLEESIDKEPHSHDNQTDKILKWWEKSLVQVVPLFLTMFHFLPNFHRWLSCWEGTRIRIVTLYFF